MDDLRPTNELSGAPTTSSTHTTYADPLSPENLAKRWFILAMFGVIVYVGIILALLASAD